ncbi:MAG: radical SAM protein [Desulfobulbaceae bacterium]|nr:radical SAM protein [Desulfobulbaceae bacterium]
MKARHPDKMPCLLFANSRGEIQDFPELHMAGRSAYQFNSPELVDLIPLPEGSELFVLPDRLPVGFDPADGEAARLLENPFDPAEGIQAVAAFVSPAHTTILSAAFEKKTASVSPLPLFAYTAVGWYDSQFWVASFRSDESPRQDACHFDPKRIKSRTLAALKRHPDNRLIQHLGGCSLTYSCPAAKNYFQGREEAPLPTSPACNAHCVGCISLQASGCCPSTQDRIKFVPTAREIAEVAVPHLNAVDRGVVSFGQGCEGEPLLQAETIEQAIRLIRKQTSRGTINLNTNASLPEAVARLADAGLDSIRVSMNSARLDQHTLYYRPSGFNFNDVCQSIAMMKKRDRFVSLNYFICPGVTDSDAETEAFCRLLSEYKPDFVQLRNLNMDPDWYLETIRHPKESRAMGIRPWLSMIKQRFPRLRYGYFNPALR